VCANVSVIGIPRVYGIRVTKAPIMTAAILPPAHNPIIKSVNQGLRLGLTLSTWFIVICVIYGKLRRTVVAKSHISFA